MTAPLTREDVIEDLCLLRRNGLEEDTNAFEHLLNHDQAQRDELAAREARIKELEEVLKTIADNPLGAYSKLAQEALDGKGRG